MHIVIVGGSMGKIGRLRLYTVWVSPALHKKGRSMMTTQLPQVTHTYQNHYLDSTRWQQLPTAAG